MDIAVIGYGSIATSLAKQLSAAGHRIFIGLKEGDFIPETAFQNLFENICIAESIEMAAASSDLIIMATSPEDVKEASYLLEDVRKKVILDFSFMNFTHFGNYFNTLSSIKAITGSSFVVKCFNASGFDKARKKTSEDDSIHMFMAGDNLKAKAITRLLMRDIGYPDIHDFGGLDSVPLLDEMAICYHHLLARKDAGEKVGIKITKSL